MQDKSIEEVFSELETDKAGLSEQRAIKNREKYGENRIVKEKRVGFFRKFLNQFKNLMVIILLASAIISLIVALTNHDAYDLIESGVIFFIVIMNAFIGVFQENKAEACLKELERKTGSHARVLRDGKEMRIPAEDVVVGDVVLLDAGDVVPADMRLIESSNLFCDESSLTGESIPSEKNHNIILNKNTSIIERVNIAFGNSLVTSGSGKGVVFSVGNDSEIGKIAKMLKNEKKELTPLQKSIVKIGKVITISVLSVCAVIFLLELFCVKDSSFISALMTSVALAVAAIPESLPAVITLIMALGVQQLAKRKAIIKRLHAVETLGCCEIICTDKTGTLTQNKMQVVTTITYSDSETEKEKLIDCMFLCNNSKIEHDVVVGEATEKAIYEYAMDKFKPRGLTKLYEISFDSTRKKMTSVYREDEIIAYNKGAFDRVITNCKFYLDGGEEKILTDEVKQKFFNSNDEMSGKALRVLAFCYKRLTDVNFDDSCEQDMVLIGLVGLRDEPRKEVKDAIKKCFKAGLKPCMITGDHKLTAFAIAKELGIAKDIDEVMTGDEIDSMPEAEFKKKLEKCTVFARVSPEHKVKIVKGFKSLKKIVAMTGDGVNDAPSVKIADIGVAMGITGTEVVKSVADMVITDDNYSTIVVAVEEGRKVYSNIQKALQYLMSSNCVEIFGMLFALIFFPNMIFLLPSQMLYVNLVTDSLPAFALGVEKVEHEIMEEPPRKINQSIFGGDVGVGIVYQAILQMIVVMTVFSLGIKFYSPQVATSMTFFTIIWLQLLHSVNCKTNLSIFQKNLVNNKLFNICFIATALLNLVVSCCPIFYKIFNLAPLSVGQWIWVAIASISIIPLCEIVKIFINHKKPAKIDKN